MKTLLHLSIAAFGLAIFNVPAATLYVSFDSTNPVPPYTNWATAANVIQDAVDASKDGDTVLVTNGVYALGGRSVTIELGDVYGDRVAITNSIALVSVNGPLVTTITGDRVWSPDWGYYEGTNRCVHLGSNAVLGGFTLTNGAGSSGGGVFGESLSAVVSNCVVMGNSAVGRAAPMGGGRSESP